GTLPAATIASPRPSVSSVVPPPTSTTRSALVAGSAAATAAYARRASSSPDTIAIGTPLAAASSPTKAAPSRARREVEDRRARLSARRGIERPAVVEPAPEPRRRERGVPRAHAALDVHLDRQEEHGIAADADHGSGPRPLRAHATDWLAASPPTCVSCHRASASSARSASASFFSRPRSVRASGGKSP